MQGLSRAGTQTSNTIIANPPSSAYNPPKTLHFPAGGNGFAHFWVWWNGGNIAKRGAQTSSYLGLNALYYPGTVGTWTSITPISPWLNFNDASGTYPMLACTKSADDVVTLRGLIKSGSVTGGTVMAKLPAACPAPDKQTVFATPSNELMGRFDVMANGDIVLRVGDNTWMALNASYVVN
jgi:hypothetical protein